MDETGQDRSMEGCDPNSPRKTRQLVLLSVVSFLSVAVLLYQTRSAMISPLGAVLALLTCGIGILPTLLYVLRNERIVPFFPMVGLFYVFCFGLSPFLLRFGWPDAPPIVYGALRLTEEPIETFVLLLLGTAVLVTTFFLVRRSALDWIPVPRIRERAGDGASLLLLWGLTVAHLAYKFIPSLAQVPSIGQFLDPAGYVAFSALLVLVLKRKMGAALRILSWGALVLITVARVESFFMSQVMMLGLCAFAALVYARAYWMAVAFASILILSMPAYLFTSTARYLPGGFFDKAKVVVTRIERYSEGVRKYDLGALQTVGRRMSYTWLFAHVVEKSPAEVAFWGGETYKPLFTVLIPRAFWPGKPREITGLTFGHRYGLLPPTSETSMNLPWNVELYANFGRSGVLVGMALIGAFLALLDRLLNAPGRRQLEAGISVGVLIPLTYQESNFSVMVGTLPQFVLCLYLYFLVGEIVLRRLGMGPALADQG
jgi:hypothetical protein